MSPDADTLTRQLGRAPRGRWRVTARCPFGNPTVIAQAPVLEDGAPFPTLMWLTCPHLCEAVSALESAGEAARWTARVSAEGDLASAVLASDAAYRAARAAEGDGVDPCAGVGIAGQADPLAVKCLHARAASFLGGVGDPVGRGVIEMIAASPGTDCGAGRCGAKADPEGA